MPRLGVSFLVVLEAGRLLEGVVRREDDLEAELETAFAAAAATSRLALVVELGILSAFVNKEEFGGFSVVNDMVVVILGNHAEDHT